MRTLVTGNHGYIGHILTHELLKAGHEVVGVDVDYFTKEVFGRKDAFESSKKVESQITKDIRDITVSDLKDLNLDCVMHLAALPNDWAADVNLKMTEDINHLGTVQLAINAKRAGVKRFIFASSAAVYGIKGDEVLTENDSPAPTTAYGISKIKAENAILPMNSNDFNVTCMRNATCYGVSPRMRFDMVLHNLMGWAFTTGSVNMYLSDGTSMRPLVHIEDVAQAYILAAEAPKYNVAGQIFSVGSENFQVKEIAELAKRTVPNADVKYAPNAPKDWRSYNLSFAKIEKMLNFKPKWTLEMGAQEVYKAYQEFGLDLDKFQNRRELWAGKNFKYLIENNLVDETLRFK